MKILFLDDDPGRIQYAVAHFANHELDIAETADQAIEFLKTKSPYDMVHLDHDLGGKIFVPSDEKSGYAVACYIEQMVKEFAPTVIIVHSHNPSGAQRMLSALRNLYALHIPFNSHNFSGVLEASKPNV